ncbi:MAG TPA: NADH-quinone oxidoreductase subunit J [Candidatus Goldiibacteriota bacterium]|nr:NADH-quinone oxidoreductase subunit J [Candidatus Goldiibacteriota bacterium]
MALVIFYLLSFLTVVAAILMVTSRNIFHSALYLAAVLFGVAGIFVLLNSYFLAGIQVLIYIGAVIVLTIFVINLTHKITGADVPQFNKQIVPAFVVSLLSTVLIILAVLKTDWFHRMQGGNVAIVDNTALIGKQFLTDFIIPFEVISVLLLAALIGAIVLVAKDRGDEK